jgi:hypothetical protein
MTDIHVAHTERGIGVVTPVGRLTMVVTRQLTEAITGLVDGGTSTWARPRSSTPRAWARSSPV